MRRLTTITIALVLTGCAMANEDSFVRQDTREIGQRIERDTDALRQVQRMIEERKYFDCIKLQRDGIAEGCIKPWLVRPEPVKDTTQKE